MSCGRPRDFIIRTLPNSVRSRALHMSRLVCNFWSLWLKFIWLFPFSSYETWIPKIFTRLCNHFRWKGLLLFFPHLPNQIAFVFSGSVLSQLAYQNCPLFLRQFRQKPSQRKTGSCHLRIGLISARFLCCIHVHMK